MSFITNGPWLVIESYNEAIVNEPKSKLGMGFQQSDAYIACDRRVHHITRIVAIQSGRAKSDGSHTLQWCCYRDLGFIAHYSMLNNDVDKHFDYVRRVSQHRVDVVKMHNNEDHYDDLAVVINVGFNKYPCLKKLLNVSPNFLRKIVESRIETDCRGFDKVDIGYATERNLGRIDVHQFHGISAPRQLTTRVPFDKEELAFIDSLRGIHTEAMSVRELIPGEKVNMNLVHNNPPQIRQLAQQLQHDQSKPNCWPASRYLRQTSDRLTIIHGDFFNGKNEGNTYVTSATLTSKTERLGDINYGRSSLEWTVREVQRLQPLILDLEVFYSNMEKERKVLNPSILEGIDNIEGPFQFIRPHIYKSIGLSVFIFSITKFTKKYHLSIIEIISLTYNAMLTESVGKFIDCLHVLEQHIELRDMFTGLGWEHYCLYWKHEGESQGQMLAPFHTKPMSREQYDRSINVIKLVSGCHKHYVGTGEDTEPQLLCRTIAIFEKYVHGAGPLTANTLAQLLSEAGLLSSHQLGYAEFAGSTHTARYLDTGYRIFSDPVLSNDENKKKFLEFSYRLLKAVSVKLCIPMSSAENLSCKFVQEHSATGVTRWRYTFIKGQEFVLFYCSIKNKIRKITKDGKIEDHTPLVDLLRVSIEDDIAPMKWAVDVKTIVKKKNWKSNRKKHQRTNRFYPLPLEEIILCQERFALMWTNAVGHVMYPSTKESISRKRQMKVRRRKFHKRGSFYHHASIDMLCTDGNSMNWTCAEVSLDKLVFNFHTVNDMNKNEKNTVHVDVIQDGKDYWFLDSRQAKEFVLMNFFFNYNRSSAISYITSRKWLRLDNNTAEDFNEGSLSKNIIGRCMLTFTERMHTNDSRQLAVSHAIIVNFKDDGVYFYMLNDNNGILEEGKYLCLRKH